VNLVADESVDAPIVEQLRSDGHELIYMAELDPGVPDDVFRTMSSSAEPMPKGGCC
jgi:hypothetical protein